MYCTWEKNSILGQRLIFLMIRLTCYSHTYMYILCVCTVCIGIVSMNCTFTSFQLSDMKCIVNELLKLIKKQSHMCTVHFMSSLFLQWNLIDESTGLTGTHEELSALSKEHTRVFTMSMWDIQQKFRWVWSHGRGHMVLYINYVHVWACTRASFLSSLGLHGLCLYFVYVVIVCGVLLL